MKFLILLFALPPAYNLAFFLNRHYRRKLTRRGGSLFWPKRYPLICRLDDALEKLGRTTHILKLYLAWEDKEKERQVKAGAEKHMAIELEVRQWVRESAQKRKIAEAAKALEDERIRLEKLAKQCPKEVLRKGMEDFV
ncbi:MAG: hypothetical protein ACXVC0_15140 [Bdellovibrionota bacterium]